MAATIRLRSDLATRPNSLAALSLIRIEKLSPDFAPVQHRIARIAEPVYGDGKIVEILDIALDGEAYDLGPASPQLCCRLFQVLHCVRQSHGDLKGHRVPSQFK